MTRAKLTTVAAMAIAVLAVSDAVAGDRVGIANIQPVREPGFVADALHPDVPAGWADEGPAPRGPYGAGVASVLSVRERPSLPFEPHFGMSQDQTGGNAFVDGVFFAPAEGVELNVKTGISEGLRGTVGVTFRF